MIYNFILPGLPIKPSGGYRVVFELANRLCAEHDVILTFPLSRPAFKFSINWILKLIKYKKKLATYHEGYKFEWFYLDERIKTKFVDEISERSLEHADYTIATSWRVAEDLLGLNIPGKIDFAQHYEYWSDKIDRINRVCASDEFVHICVSKWVKDKIKQLGATNVYNIPIGVNRNLFKLIEPIGGRSNGNICFMYHRAKWKGTHVVIKALNNLKRKGFNISVSAFGVYARRNEQVIDRYYLNPPQGELADIYNSNAIFISSSLSEGLGLPPMEAMACGCAVVATDSGGIRDFCVNGVSSIVVDPECPEQMEAAIEKLLTDDSLRIKLANAGNNRILSEFTWDHTIKSFMSITNDI